MAKSKKIFQCISCSHETNKWTGKCGECGEWNTVSERIVSKSSKSSISSSIKTPQRISDISGDKAERIPINDLEFNRVIGNGLVKGSVILLGGEPGIGKSTLTLKIALTLKEKVLYISWQFKIEPFIRKMVYYLIYKGGNTICLICSPCNK